MWRFSVFSSAPQSGASKVVILLNLELWNLLVRLIYSDRSLLVILDPLEKKHTHTQITNGNVEWSPMRGHSKFRSTHARLPLLKASGGEKKKNTNRGCETYIDDLYGRRSDRSISGFCHSSAQNHKVISMSQNCPHTLQSCPVGQQPYHWIGEKAAFLVTWTAELL